MYKKKIHVLYILCYMYISKNSKITTDFNLEDTREKNLPFL